MTATTSETTTTGQPGGPDGETPGPLGAGWLTVTVVIGVMAALIAAAGMTLSFHAVSVRMTPSFGPRWAWLVPLVVDLTVLVFSGVDLVLSRLGISHPLARWTVYGATFGTVWLNYSAGGDPVGRVAHVLMPAVWVMFVEIMRHVVRRVALNAGASRREPIPTARWLLAPLPTFLLWRRMILWRVNKYTVALAREEDRLGAIATAQDIEGRLWRFKIGPVLRLRLSLGKIDAEGMRDALIVSVVQPPAPRTSSAPVLDATRDTPVQDTVLPPTPPVDTGPVQDATPRGDRRRVQGQDTRRAPDAVPSIDREADLAALRGEDTSWTDLAAAEAIRRADTRLPGHQAGYVARLLTDLGVNVNVDNVRKVRQRARKSGLAGDALDADPEAQAN